MVSDLILWCAVRPVNFCGRLPIQLVHEREHSSD